MSIYAQASVNKPRVHMSKILFETRLENGYGIHMDMKSTVANSETHAHTNPDSKVHGTNMEPTWVLSAPGGPHVGPMNLAIWVIWQNVYSKEQGPFISYTLGTDVVA